MEMVGTYEAKTNLAKLLERVNKGETIGITKHGVPIAILTPPVQTKKAHPRQTISELKSFRDKNLLKGISLRKMIEEGRR
ncbi:MAG TPA: type II toxin-antitoxin system prevent-host-death family antitoxin [Syntrophaceae bacterium]|jgi:prevent-host-death family protein|nr:type II toxin-antitoxin system prevent-host-death family antitoxin [Syntrophaceae bacterium]